MDTLGISSRDGRLKKRLQLRGIAVKRVQPLKQAVPIALACPDCNVVNGHTGDCSLDMGNDAMRGGR